MNSIVYNMDCMDGMKQYPDKYFDLAVVDPPYGIDHNNGGGRYEKWNKPQHKWDSLPPSYDYFNELYRISKNQIIWGANHYSNMPSTKGFIFWYKQNPVPNFSDGEYAYTSFQIPAKCFDFRYYGNLEGNTSAEEKIHPTQKPVALYDWIYKNYLPNGGKVLDTHGGSMSNLIAALKAGNIEMHVYEIDKDYFKDAKQRVELFQSQGNLFAEKSHVIWI